MKTLELRTFLKTHYIDKHGAPDIETAIRDCLTDMFHVADSEGFDLREKIDSAEEVFVVEIQE